MNAKYITRDAQIPQDSTRRPGMPARCRTSTALQSTSRTHRHDLASTAPSSMHPFVHHARHWPSESQISPCRGIGMLSCVTYLRCHCRLAQAGLGTDAPAADAGVAAEHGREAFMSEPESSPLSSEGEASELESLHNFSQA